ncbi:MAG: hypothetical protein U1E02_17415 [Hydrogenophaga sp.]|jgi:hypothetical protein|uniref:hypothetical protein n=1 Tax=Hydrogenophaga sp. TaxID=1904254 RepID=UPI0010D65029|nr:hypothetical protein [Hydrogenophaga sp.]MDP1783353.1 hypothetical protein [Hydrogenophaga sp.]MDP2249098.1 hypothetical protein [Hydrogenophaga sp.]MDZ4125934.1 hypothetical protein [Hydrogenophaga sp.]
MRTVLSRLTAVSVLAVAVAGLSACAGYAPPSDPSGLSRDEIVARMGPPEMQRQVAGGSRLEFPRGPYGVHTWFVYLDANGRATRSEQVLTEANFLRINPGMSQEEARQVLGRAGEVQGLGRNRGQVWSYRYDNPFCRWFQIEIAEDQTVRSAGYGEPPECAKRDDATHP